MYKIEELSDNVIVLKPEFDIELENLDLVNKMKEEIFRWIKDRNEPVLILNLEECQFIDSTGLGNLIRIYEKIRRKKGKFLATNLNENIKNIFEITTLDNIIQCYDNLSSAKENI